MLIEEIKSPFYSSHCTACGGSGQIPAFKGSGELFRDCFNCNGTGKIISELGKQLMEFLKDQYKGRF